MVQKEQKQPVSSDILLSHLTQAFNEVKQGFYTAINFIQTELMKLLSIIYRNLKSIWQRVILPIAITCLNILGYLLDRLLLGPPCFRAVLVDGAIFLPNLASFKSWVNSNQGWNIYRSFQGSADNVIGFILGGGLGWMHYLSHLLTSIINISRPLINLLGNKGVVGPKLHYSDERHEALIVCFGLLSLPVVIPLICLANGIISLFTFAKHLGLSLFHNINSTFNLLGERGIFGARNPYQDLRHKATRISFGLLSAPIVIPLVLLLNGTDLIISGAKKTLLNKQFIKKSLLILLSLPIVLMTALPAFILRKTVKGLYNFTLRPLASYMSGQPINKRAILTGVANVISLGGCSAFTKIFKAYTGYTYRFGYPNALHNAQSLPPEILDIRLRFKHAIDLAARGRLCIPEEERTDTSQRPWLRLFYGFRSSYEKILKEYHDIFEQCVQEYQGEKNPTVSCTDRFFKKIKPSPHYIHHEVLSYLDLNPGV